MTKNHITDLLDKQFDRKNDVAMITKKNNEEISYTWNEVKTSVDSIAYLLLELGIKSQDKVGIFSENIPEWSIIDFACLKSRVCTVPIYPTTTTEHLIHIVNDSDLKILFTGNKDQYDKALEVKEHCPNLEHIYHINENISEVDIEGEMTRFDFLVYQYKNIERDDLKEVYEERSKEHRDDDLVTLIYTSGTTGMPKGVQLTKRNFNAALSAHTKRIKITESDRSLCFLPLSHIFERAWTYFVLLSGGQNYYLSNPQDVASTIKEVKPTVMSSVPRFFEKVYNKVQDDLDKSSEKKRKVFRWATRIGRKIFSRKMNNEFVGPLLKIQHIIATKLVYSKFKDSFGGRIRFFNCGGASLQDDVNMFFQSLSLPIIYGYGMTETLATVSCYKKIPMIGSIGKPMDGIEVKIDPSNNEILVRGDTITKGYYNLPEENEKLFTVDGFLRTGDAGRIDAEGNLFYVERIKELMKTSNGKYIAPQNVESTIMKDKYVEQIAIVAEGETFVSALIVPNYEMLEEYAKEMSIKFKNKAELINNSDIKSMLDKRIKEVQKSLHGFEQVKKFKLLEEQFSIKANEITPTLKLKRKVIMEKYKHMIDELYNKRTSNVDIKNKTKEEKVEEAVFTED